MENIFRKVMLVGVLGVVWCFFAYLTFYTKNDKNATVRFLGYFAVIVVTILEFLVILDQYFGIKLSDLIR